MPKVYLFATQALLVVLFPAFLFNSVALTAQESISMIYTDFDETFTNTHSPEEQIGGEIEGVYQTFYRLFRVQKTDLLPRDPSSKEKVLLESLPQHVDIPLAEYRKLQEYFAKSANNAGTSFEQFTLKSGITIYPSLYYLDHNFSYEPFRSNSSTNNLLEIYKKSAAAMSDLDPKKYSMFGIAYPIVILSMIPNPVNPEVPLILSKIETAGGFAKHHVQEFFAYLAKTHGIKDHHEPHWDSLALSEHSELSHYQILAEEKWNKIKEALDDLEKTPIGADAIQRRHPYDPSLKARLHYFAFEEDNPSVYNHLVDIIRRSVANQQYRNIKVGLMCSATREDWDKLIKPRNALGGLFRNTIFIPDGTTREMTKEEFLGEPLVYKDTKDQKQFEKEIQKKFKPSCQLAFGLE